MVCVCSGEMSRPSCSSPRIATLQSWGEQLWPVEVRLNQGFRPRVPISRGAREAIFLYELATKDFGLSVAKPKLWTDSSAALSASKRVEPGSKLRHLEVCEFYVQGAIQEGYLSIGKCKGTWNPANFPTKHAKTGTALPSLGLVEGLDLDLERLHVKVSAVKQAWKPGYPTQLHGVDAGATAHGAGAAAKDPRAGGSALRRSGNLSRGIKAVVFASSVTGAGVQGRWAMPWHNMPWNEVAVQVLLVGVLTTVEHLSQWAREAYRYWQGEPTPSLP